MVQREIRGRGTNIESFGGTRNGEPREILWSPPSHVAPEDEERGEEGAKDGPTGGGEGVTAASQWSG